MTLRSAVRVGLLTCVTLMGACTQYVSTPEVDLVGVAAVQAAEKQAILQRITPKPTISPTARIDLPTPRRSVRSPQVGDSLGHGITVTPELEKLWQATDDKDWKYWQSALSDAAKSLPDSPEARFILSSQRIKTMIHAGRPGDVFEELKRLERLEGDLFGDHAETISQYGQVHFWLNDPDTAIGYYGRLLEDTGDWWLPTLYYGKPENIGNAKRLAGAMLRAYIGMAGAHVMKKDYQTAMAWGELGVRRNMDVVGITHHPLYGQFVETTSYMYEGMAWNLTFYVAGRIGVSRDLEANQFLVDAAKAFFGQAGYRWGDTVVDSVVDFVMFDTGMKPQATEVIGVLDEPSLVTPERLAAALRLRPKNLETREEIELPVPPASSINLPGEGAVNAYDFTVGPQLAAANALFLEGEYEDAYTRYRQVETSTTDPLRRWHASNAAIKTLISGGRSAEAMTALDENEALEVAFFGTNLNARTLRGDVKFWLGDHRGAIADYLSATEALGGFRAPTLFVFPPQIPQLALMNRSQFRATLGIARSYMYLGDYEAALPWAEAAEQLFEESHYSWQHQLYSAYLKIDSDMFYGRGVNLAVIAASRLALSKGAERSEAEFAAAKSYLEALDFESGLLVVDAIRARALLDAGATREAASVALDAARFAASTGQSDLLWQLEAMRGQALADLGEHRAAEAAFRAAQVAVDAVSGSLATDSSKRQFGIGKDEITRRLANYDLARRDYRGAFADLERGRARAFIDMLADVQVEAGKGGGLVASIREVDGQIRAARVQATVPGRIARRQTQTVSRLLSKRAGLVRRLHRQDPDLASAFSHQSTDLENVRRRLGRDDAMIYVLPTADEKTEKIRLLAIDRRSARVIETALTHDEVLGLLTPFTTDNPLGEAAAQDEAAQKLATGLSLDTWGGRGVIYLVPSKSFYFVPWGALDVAAPVVVLPTGSWLERASSKGRRSGAVVVGDPKLGEDWTILPGAREEAAEVGRIHAVEPLIGDAATIDAVRARAGNGVRILHLATHGLFNGRDPLQSAILLSNKGQPERLTANALFEAPVRADLVVMSACETGVGHVSAGEDFLGLARSFYLSGTRAVVNSLWPVHDKPTRTFMRVFHEALGDGRDVAAAWVAARDRLRADGFPPSIYGAFVLGGAAKI